MKKKRLIWGLVLAGVMVLAAWMLWPRPLAAAFDAGRQLATTVTVSGVEVEEYIAHPTMETETFTVEADSPESAAVQAVLEEYSYHLCLDSLTGENGLEDIGEISVLLYNNAGEKLHIFSGTGKLFCNDRIVRLGYWGNKDAAALCGELTAALGNAH